MNNGKNLTSREILFKIIEKHGFDTIEIPWEHPMIYCWNSTKEDDKWEFLIRENDQLIWLHTFYSYCFKHNMLCNGNSYDDVINWITDELNNPESTLILVNTHEYNDAIEVAHGPIRNIYDLLIKIDLV